MRILGIDPGFAIVGFGIVDFDKYSFSLKTYGTITTEAKTDYNLRLRDIYKDLTELIEKTKPDVAAIEKLYFNTNQKTAIGVAQARGVILLAAVNAGLTVYEYTPLQVKSAVTGYGQAEKLQVMEMTRQILHLKEVPKPDDAADALAIAIAHAHSAKPITF
ncbi:MAG: crossover junction endodeoxyribonuclease RuvC [Ruminococcus sp.]|jgi:crossover junction endodeoxyribonuclease RuvC|nr:crossover junction endodeoxyribonuclease RuvC [Ruminococcus sp.]